MKRPLFSAVSLGVFVCSSLTVRASEDGGAAQSNLGGAALRQLPHVPAMFPREISAGLQNLLSRGLSADPGVATLARPLGGALAGRASGAAQDAGLTSVFKVPEAFTVVIWVRIDGLDRAETLFGFGDFEGDYILASTDSAGIPVLTFLGRGGITQESRAVISPSRIADSRLHAVVVVINLGSGLARLYVDGKPEAASALTMWRPREFGFAFAKYSLQGQINAPGVDATGILLPRVVNRELSESEIATLKPREDQFGQEAADIKPDLASELIRTTLVEFWPSGYDYLLRRRPL